MKFRNSCKVFVVALSFMLVALGQNASWGATPPPSMTIQFPKKFSAVVVAPGNRTFAVVTPFVFEKRKYSSLAIWSVASAKKLRAWSVPGGMTSLPAYSLDGMLIVGASADNSVRVWEVATGTVKDAVSTTTPMQVVVFAGSDKRIVMGGGSLVDKQKDDRVFVYNLATRSMTRLLPDGSYRIASYAGVTTLAASRDGNKIIVGYMYLSEDSVLGTAFYFPEQTIAFYNPRELTKPKHEITILSTNIVTYAYQTPLNLNFSEDGRTLVHQMMNAVQLREAETGNLLREWKTRDYIIRPVEGYIPPHQDTVTTLTWNHTSKTLIGGTESGMVYLWNDADGRSRLDFKAHEKKIIAASYSQRDKTLISASDDGTVKIWHIP